MKRHLSDDDIESSSQESLIESPPSEQWVDKYAPHSTAELCINPSKLKQVRSEIQQMASGAFKLLILTGPTGSSKSSTVKLLAKELYERKRPVVSGSFGSFSSLGSFRGPSLSDSYLVEYIESSIDGIPQPEHFGDFLRDSQYRSDCVVLVEELPNVFHAETLRNFRQAIREWIYSDERRPPLVLCLTEIDCDGDSYAYSIDTNLNADTLLGREIMANAHVHTIKFNAVANKFLKKLVSRVVSSEPVFRTVSKSELSSVMESLVRIGDVRSVLANLQMWSASAHVPGVRENQIDLFHAIGKIVFSSSEYTHLDDGLADYNSVQAVLDNYGNLSLLSLALLENYHVYKDGQYAVEAAANIVDGLSISDVMGLEEYGIRNARAQLRSVGTATATHRLRIKFPRHFRMKREANSSRTRIAAYRRWIDHWCTFDELNMVEGYWRPMILNKKHPKRFVYDRLGGSFREIHADEQAGVIDVLEPEVNLPMDQFQLDINEQEQESESELSDPIESDEETSIKRIDGCSDVKRITDNLECDDSVDWSDDELDLLITQGKV